MVEDLEISGTHGHYARERRGSQRFSVTVRAGVDLSRAAHSDKLRDSVNYSRLKEIAESVFQKAPRYLLESLAEEIAHEVLSDTRVHTVDVTIKKLEIWDNGVPSITISRSH